MKRLNRIIASFLSMILIFGVSAESQATVNNNIRIYEMGDDDFNVAIDMQNLQRGNELDCSMSLYKTASNTVVASFSTGTGQLSSEIGVRDFVFQKKSGWFWWTDLYANSFCDYNTYTYGGAVEYTAPVSGETYRAIGTHYAIIDGTEYTHIMISDELDYE